jgi:hypothetical protein
LPPDQSAEQVLKSILEVLHSPVLGTE